MMATVPHVTSSLGLRKFQADGFLLTRVYHSTSQENGEIYRVFYVLVQYRENVVFVNTSNDDVNDDDDDEDDEDDESKKLSLGTS